MGRWGIRSSASRWAMSAGTETPWSSARRTRTAVRLASMATSATSQRGTQEPPTCSSGPWVAAGSQQAYLQGVERTDVGQVRHSPFALERRREHARRRRDARGQRCAWHHSGGATRRTTPPIWRARPTSCPQRDDLDAAGVPQGLERRRDDSSAGRWRQPGRRHGRGRRADEESGATGVDGNQEDDGGRCGRGLRLRAQRRGVDAAGVHQGVERQAAIASASPSQCSRDGNTLALTAITRTAAPSGVGGVGRRRGAEVRCRVRVRPERRHVDPAGVREASTTVRNIRLRLCVGAARRHTLGRGRG